MLVFGIDVEAGERSSRAAAVCARHVVSVKRAVHAGRVQAGRALHHHTGAARRSRGDLVVVAIFVPQFNPIQHKVVKQSAAPRLSNLMYPLLQVTDVLVMWLLCRGLFFSPWFSIRLWTKSIWVATFSLAVWTSARSSCLRASGCPKLVTRSAPTS
jgi:hypothetical protein